MAGEESRHTKSLFHEILRFVTLAQNDGEAYGGSIPSLHELSLVRNFAVLKFLIAQEVSPLHFVPVGSIPSLHELSLVRNFAELL